MREKKGPKFKDSFFFLDEEVSNWKINIKKYIFTNTVKLAGIKTF